MHDDRWRVVLRARVAAAAIRSSIYRCGVLVRARDREGVTRGAIGARGGTKTPARLLCGMFDTRLLGMACRAALRHDAADGVTRELVALAARNPFAHHVHQVTADLARRLPDRIHVHASPRRTARRW
jgi:hypothetical protein